VRPLLVASVAQLVEQLTLNQLVVGSNPPRGTIFSRSWIAQQSFASEQNLAALLSLCERPARHSQNAKE
jgi:hypothetical protein